MIQMIINMLILKFPLCCTLKLELCVVGNHNIKSMDGLHVLISMESLWLCETGISKIESLIGCTQLKQLYLYGNAISKIENLEGLNALETLDLHSNAICVIDAGLAVISDTLQVLNIADNRIEALDALAISPRTATFKRLREFDCAGNQIRSIRELHNLSALPCLVDVAFESRDFVANPVCHEPSYLYTIHTAVHGKLCVVREMPFGMQFSRALTDFFFLCIYGCDCVNVGLVSSDLLQG